MDKPAPISKVVRPHGALLRVPVNPTALESGEYNDAISVDVNTLH